MCNNALFATHKNNHSNISFNIFIPHKSFFVFHLKRTFVLSVKYSLSFYLLNTNVECVYVCVFVCVCLCGGMCDSPASALLTSLRCCVAIHIGALNWFRLYPGERTLISQSKYSICSPCNRHNHSFVILNWFIIRRREPQIETNRAKSVRKNDFEFIAFA